MDRETNDLIARQYLSEKNLGGVEPREYAEWAARKLDEGQDGDALRTLASTQVSGSPELVESAFRECVSELGWEIPGRKKCLKLHSESILQRIVDGEIEPYDGCSNLYIISIYLGHPDYLYNWNGLFWTRQDLGVEELNELILDEARRELAGEMIINESLPHHEEEDEESPGFLERLRELVRWR